MLDRSQNISEKKKEALRYQLAKLEVLVKRRAGQYCILDWKKRKIIASGEQKKKNKLNSELVTKKQTEEVVIFLKSLNAYLEKVDNLERMNLWLSNLSAEEQRGVKKNV
jgi:hypothetical protein